MKSFLYLIAGLSAAAAYVILSNQKARTTPLPVSDLAHRLQDAWADHHTVA